MKNSKMMLAKGLWLSMIALLLGLSQTGQSVAAERAMIAFGDPFPEMLLPTPDEASGRDYLGLTEGRSFTPSQIKTELLFVEMLNVHCVHCQMQVPAYNELFKLLEADAETRGRIKILGIAIGNQPGEVAQFRKKFQVPFPIVADPGFATYRALGVGSTPFSIYIRQDQPGQPGVVADTHSGLNTNYSSLAAELQRLSHEDLEELRRRGADAVRVRQAITPLYSEEELEFKVRTAFIDTGGILVNLDRLQLQSGRRVYMADMRRGEETVRLFAEVTSRQSICDICHDVHFIYVFDKTARVVGFEPLQLTKYGNVHWSKQDAETMRKRLAGQYLSAPRPFDPQLDAVSSATISSAIIFDSLSDGEGLLAELHKEGLL